jgi:hypothetical protein
MTPDTGIGGEAPLDLQALSEAECLRLLTENNAGRIAVVADGQIVIRPVNYVVDDDSIVVRTNWARLIHMCPASMAFEIDGYDAVRGTGWSVLVHGFGHDVTDALDVTSEHLQTLAVSPWAPGPQPRLLRVVVQAISGHRYGG